MKKERVITHYGYYRIANRLKIVRFLALALFLLFALVLFLAFRQDMTLNHLRYFLHNIDLTPNATLSSGDTIYYAGDPDSEFGFVAGGLACLTDTRVFVTDRSSGTTFSEYHGFAAPRAVFSDNYMAVYDRKGSSLYLYNAFSRLESFHYDGTVLSAAVADNGTLAVAVSEDNGYYTTVYVYNSRFEQVNKLSKYKYVTSLALSDNGKHLAVGSVYAAKDGYFSSELLYMKVGEKQSISEYVMNGEAVWQVSFGEDGSLALVTDRALHILDEDGKSTKTENFGEAVPRKSYLGKESILFFSSGSDGRSDTLRLYSYGGRLLCEKTLDGVCTGAAEDASGFFLTLDCGVLLTFDKTGQLLNETSLAEEGKLVSNGSAVYYATSSSATLLPFKEEREK